MIPLRDDNPTELKPIVTMVLIGACVAAFVWQLAQGEEGAQRVVYQLGFIPATLFAGQSLPPELALVPPWTTVLTSMFLHGGWLHLIGNMLYLWIFGNNVEDALGHVRFVFFYVVCGIGAALAQAAIDPASEIPMIGASGAISGVLGAYLLLYPRAHVMVLLPLGFFSRMLRLPAMAVLLLWIVLQGLNAFLTQGGEGGGVAWMAHVGGFVAGMALIVVPGVRRRGVRLFAPARSRADLVDLARMRGRRGRRDRWR